MRLTRILAAIRAILGVPDYARYVEHLRRHHPEMSPLSRRDFERRWVEERYARPGSRCC